MCSMVQSRVAQPEGAQLQDRSQLSSSGGSVLDAWPLMLSRAGDPACAQVCLLLSARLCTATGMTASLAGGPWACLSDTSMPREAKFMVLLPGADDFCVGDIPLPRP